MAFIDGENLTMRYQAMLTKGNVPLVDTVSVTDVLAWNPKAINAFSFVELLRATYYTYAVGTDEQIEKWKTEIRKFPYKYRSESFRYEGSMYPKIFKKPQRTAKRKGVDISIAVDALNHVYNNDVDLVILMTGDGDYKPLIEEIMRRGKRVYLAALSDGLNPILPNLVDLFHSLDSLFFKQ